MDFAADTLLDSFTDMSSRRESELPDNGTMISRRISGNHIILENAFLQISYASFFVICVLLTTILIAFNAHVIYFSARRLLEVTAGYRYLFCVVITHALLAIMEFVIQIIRCVDAQEFIRQRLYLAGAYDVIHMSFLCSTLALLVDRYLFITQGIAYDSFVSEKRSNVIIGIIMSLSLLLGAIVSPLITRRIYTYLSVTISLAIFGFDLFRNFKIYSITTHPLTQQQRIDFSREKGKRLLVLFLETIMTIIQVYAPVVTILHTLQIERVIVRIREDHGRYLRIIQALSWGICVMWYIVTDRKLRDMYKKHGLYSVCSCNKKCGESLEV